MRAVSWWRGWWDDDDDGHVCVIDLHHLGPSVRAARRRPGEGGGEGRREGRRKERGGVVSGVWRGED